MKKTNWYVLTGAPCSGKTVVIRELERRGQAVIHEVARAFIDAEIAKGRAIGQIKADPAAFERQLLGAKIEIEAALDPDAVIFLDRAVPDSIAYYQQVGLDAVEPFRSSRMFRYRQIFLFDRIGLKQDGIRTEDEQTATELEDLLRGAYRRLGYQPIRVPLRPVAERVDFILERL